MKNKFLRWSLTLFCIMTNKCTIN